ncbi:hypothetical protein AVEN_164957-1, partial [Araneus ventricosus]
MTHGSITRDLSEERSENYGSGTYGSNMTERLRTNIISGAVPGGGIRGTNNR